MRWLMIAFLPLLAGVEMGGEFLYWQPSVEPFSYGISFEQTLSPAELRCEIYEISPGFSCGFRFYARCESQGCELVLSGLRICSIDRTRLDWPRAATPNTRYISSVVGLSARNINGGALRGSDRVSIHNEYWNVDLKGGWCFTPCSPLFLSLWFAGRYVNYDYTVTSDASLVANLSSFSAQSRRLHCFSGGGPGVGVGCNVCLGWGLQVRTSLLGLMVIGPSRLGGEVQGVGSGINGLPFSIRLPTRTAISPAVDGELAASLSRQFADVYLRLELGYALHHYFQLLQDFATTANGRFTSFDNFPVQQLTTLDAGFGGPFFSFSVHF